VGRSIIAREAAMAASPDCYKSGNYMNDLCESHPQRYDDEEDRVGTSGQSIYTIFQNINVNRHSIRRTAQMNTTCRPGYS
jgi:hypothetical protein